MSTLPDFDKLWDYNDPASTEKKFREILIHDDTQADPSYHLQLLTQIARTFSLRRLFTEAHALLDEVLAKLPVSVRLEHVRYHLERGRTFNSSGEKEKAINEFTAALTDAEQVRDDFYTVDALHMLAIASEPDEAIAWNAQAIYLAEKSDSGRANNWLGSLYNNLGWAWFDKQEYDKARQIFETGYEWQLSKHRPAAAGIAKWSIARTLRAMGYPGEALQMQMELLADNIKPDKHNYEEIGECLKALGRTEEAKGYAEKAKEL